MSARTSDAGQPLAPRSATALHKRTVYLPGKVKTGSQAGQPRMRKNLNATVHVETGAVVCRHLAMGYLHNRRFLDEAAQNQQDLQRYFSHGTLAHLENKFQSWLKCEPAAKQLLSPQKFGHWLADMAVEMEKRTTPCADAMMLTPGHAMAVRIQRKSRPESNYLRITCYDPNGTPPGGTGNHTSIEVAKPDDLRLYSLQNFVSLGRYFPDRNVAAPCVTMLCPQVPLPQARALTYLQGRVQAGIPPARHATLFKTAIQRHLPQTLQALGKALAASGTRGSQALPLFAAYTNGTPPLHYATRLKRPDLFRSIARALHDLEVHGQDALQALEAKGSTGRTALEMSIECGNVAAYSDFAAALATLNIDPAAALTALQTGQRRGTPLLFRAVQRMHPGAFTHFAHALHILQTPQAEALALLQAHNDEGIPALFEAATNAHTGAFIDFAKALVCLKVPQDAALAALRGNDPEGTPALYMAVQESFPRAFTSFAKALAILGIQGDKARQALQCPAEDGTTTFDLIGNNVDLKKDLQDALALIK